MSQTTSQSQKPKENPHRTTLAGNLQETERSSTIRPAHGAGQTFIQRRRKVEIFLPIQS